jgi:hypothetical protein
MVMNKRGWMRILEATVAVLIVSGVLIVLYSRQVDRGMEPAEYFHGLQGRVLMDISSNSDLRLMVLGDMEQSLTYFVDRKIPLAFSYFLRICDLGGAGDFCKIDDAAIVGATQDKEIFVEEAIISADLGDGDSAVYAPKKVRLFIWEEKRVGLFPGESCDDDVKNQDESDVDCGGFFCYGCSLDKMCSVDLDCLSRNCPAGVCEENLLEFCGDGVIGGDEVCDGFNLGNPPKTCVDMGEGFSRGILGCSMNCLNYDTSGCVI